MSTFVGILNFGLKKIQTMYTWKNWIKNNYQKMAIAKLAMITGLVLHFSMPLKNSNTFLQTVVCVRAFLIDATFIYSSSWCFCACFSVWIVTRGYWLRDSQANVISLSCLVNLIASKQMVNWSRSITYNHSFEDEMRREADFRYLVSARIFRFVNLS